MELGVTQRDRNRLRVMTQLEHQQLTQAQAGRLLGLGERQVRRTCRAGCRGGWGQVYSEPEHSTWPQEVTP